MDNRKLGQLEVSPIGMGCMGFSHGYGQVPPEAYAIEAIRRAYDYGCTHFDTAEAYGKEQFYAGHNEELVGNAIEPFRKKVVLATKFHIGELSKPDERTKKLKTLEQRAYSESQTQLFIETPYRNHKMIEDILQNCRPQTKLCIAANITCEGEYIQTRTVKDWKGHVPELSKIPCIFLLYK